MFVLLLPPPGLPPAPNPQPQWNYWPLFQRGVDDAVGHLNQFIPAFPGGPLTPNQALCIRAKMGRATVNGLRKIFKKVIGTGQAPSFYASMEPQLAALDLYFYREEFTYCKGPDGIRAEDALKYLQNHGYPIAVIGGLGLVEAGPGGALKLTIPWSKVAPQGLVGPDNLILGAMGLGVLLLVAPPTAPIILVFAI